MAKMDPSLRRFLAEHYSENQAAAIPLRELAEAFRATLPEDDRTWTRQRLVGELARGGYQLGQINKVLHIAGLVAKHAVLRSVGGQLERTYAR